MVTQLARIRDPSPSEMQDIFNVECKCFPDPYPLSLLNQLHSMHPDGFLIAEAGGEIWGYVIGVLRWGKTGHILSIAVDPPHRGQGIGSALMAGILNRLRAKGAKGVRLEVRKSNLGAQKFYLKLGFRVMEEIPFYYEDGETAVAMEFEL